MCVMLGFTEADRAFDATVLDTTEKETVDGVLEGIRKLQRLFTRSRR